MLSTCSSLILRLASTLLAEMKLVNFMWKHALVPVLLPYSHEGARVCSLYLPLESLCASSVYENAFFLSVNICLVFLMRLW